MLKRKNQKHPVRSQQKGCNFKLFINSAHDNLNAKQLLGQGDIPELSIRKEELLRESSSLLPAQPLKPRTPRDAE